MKKLGKMINVFCLFGLLGMTNGHAFLFPASAATAYNLSSPIPSEASLSHVIQGRQSYSGQHIMWRDNEGQINIINSFGGADVAGNEKAYIHYINTFTGTHALVEGGACSFGRQGKMAYDPIHNKFYWSGEYCNRTLGGSFNEFDPVTMTNTVIATGVGQWWTALSMVMGADNKIYFIPMDADGQGSHVFSYDPAIGASSWTDYGVFYGPSNGISPGLYVDSQYIYVAWQQNIAPNNYHLMIHSIGSGSWSEHDFGDGLSATGLRFFIERNTGKWYLNRTTSSGTTNYWPENGGANFISGGVLSANAAEEWVAKWNCAVTMGYGDYSVFNTAYDYDMNWDYAMPNPGNTESKVYYGPHSSWNYPDSGFSTSTLDYTGPWYDLAVNTVVPHSGESEFYGIGESITDYNYGNETKDYVYMRNLPSVYHSMKVPASASPLNTEEVYISGYANQFWRWNPSEPWSTSNPKALSFPEHMNYRVFADYDAEGKIWLGGNMCGATAGCVDYGSVAWYDPETEQKGEMFQGVWTGGNPPATGNGIKYTNLAMSNNRTKVVVSSNDGKLTVINALTKTIEGTYNLGKKAFMVEVDNDRVLGITKDGDPSQAFLFRPSTRTMITSPQAIGVSGQTFGSADGSSARRGFKLEKGPDGYAWLFVDKKIYRVHPTTLAFEHIATDSGDSNKLIWAENKKDLLLYGRVSPSVFSNLLTPSIEYLFADLNNDDSVNATDFNIFKLDFQKLAASLTNPKSDIDGDGQATVKDVGIMMSNWNN